MAVLTRLEPPILRVTLDRPKANAFDQTQLDDLTEAFRRVAAVDGGRVVLLDAEGETAFSAGADLGAVGPLAEPDGLSRWTAQAHALLDHIASLPIPVIAVIRRPAVGGGFELALACHLRVMSQTAHLALPEIKLGYLPSWAAVERLVPLVGLGLTTDLLLTGRKLFAEEALARGIVHRVADDADRAARELAETLARLPPLAVRAALEQVAGAARREPRESLRSRELVDLEKLVRTEDTVEGVMAFFEKRAPTFQGK